MLKSELQGAKGNWEKKKMILVLSHYIFYLYTLEKTRSFLTSCVFWFVFLNAGSHLYVSDFLL